VDVLPPEAAKVELLAVIDDRRGFGDEDVASLRELETPIPLLTGAAVALVER
jgi:hypothetical protein